ncbi:MAG: SHOCT domain-containing protein [Actinomycetota bacterium]|nr:SHOCT domain-containing protein [Actinomycetota bacterium]
MWVWPVLVLVSLVLVVMGMVWLLRGSSPAGRDLESGGSARRILDGRYARGEIDDEEYRRRRDQLR